MFKILHRSGFVAGIAIGLSIATPSHAARMIQLDDDPPTGGEGAGSDPTLEETPGGGFGSGGQSTGLAGFASYVAMRESLQQTTFGGNTGFSFAYSVDVFPSEIGSYTISNSYQIATLRVFRYTPRLAATSIAMTLPQFSTLGATNVQIGIIDGSIVGPTGESREVELLVASWDQQDGSRTNRVIPLRYRTEQDFSTIDYWVRSTPSSIVTGTPDGLRTEFSSLCLGITNPQEACICLAQSAYDTCADFVRLRQESCLAKAEAYIAAAAAGCLIAGLTPFAWAALAGCFIALALALMERDACFSASTLDRKQCLDAYQQALRGCGILIFELR
jgi:hypothetical protein